MTDLKEHVSARGSATSLLAGRFSKHPERYILLVDNTPGLISRTLISLSHYSPIQFWRPDDLTLHARESALINLSDDELNALKQTGLEADSRVFGSLTISYLH